MESSACRRRASAKQLASLCSETAEPGPLKEEPEWDECVGSETAEEKWLYAGHEVKEEIVFGPEVVQEQDIAYSMQNPLKLSPVDGAHGPSCYQEAALQYGLKSCSVNLDRLPVRTLHTASTRNHAIERESILAFKKPATVNRIRPKNIGELQGGGILEGLLTSKRRRALTLVPQPPSSPSLLSPIPQQQREDCASNVSSPAMVPQLVSPPSFLSPSLQHSLLAGDDRASNAPSPAMILGDCNSVWGPKTPTGSTPGQPALHGLAKMAWNFGSESESDESDEDVAPYPAIPRVFLASMDTPEDEEPELAPPHAPHAASPGDTPSEPVTSEDFSSVGAAPNTPAEITPSQPPLPDLAMLAACNLGSESEPDDSDEDELPQPIIPRAFRAHLETPEDEETELTSPPHPTSPHSVESNAFLDFKWSPLPNPPNLCLLRRETFSNNNVGPTAQYADPYDVFIAIWDRSFMEQIASETNKYGQQLAHDHLQSSSRISQWEDTTADELYVFLAILLAMGVVDEGRIKEYWSPDVNIFATPGFAAYMSLRRFQLLSRCLHFRDNRDMPLNTDVSEAKIFKIQPVIDHLNARFQSMYNLQQNVALDESLLQKGWDHYIPNDSATVDIDTLELCEPQTGYLWRFVVYARKRTETAALDPLQAFTPRLVLTLLQGLEDRGHTVWMNHHYNSPALARKLKTLGFDCVGTLCTNRQFVPKELTSLTKEDMRRGQLIGYTSGDVDVAVWRGDYRVGAISTYHGAAVNYIKGNSRPALIYEYNVITGYLDKRERMLANFSERSRLKVWYKKLFHHLLNVCVFNSYTIWKHSNATTRLAFRSALVESILARHAPLAPRAAPESSRCVYPVREHYLGEFDFLPSARSRCRRVCKICKKRVSTYCVGCNKAVCMNTCFVVLHRV